MELSIKKGNAASAVGAHGLNVRNPVAIVSFTEIEHVLMVTTSAQQKNVKWEGAMRSRRISSFKNVASGVFG